MHPRSNSPSIKYSGIAITGSSQFLWRASALASSYEKHNLLLLFELQVRVVGLVFRKSKNPGARFPIDQPRSFISPHFTTQNYNKYI